MGGFERLKASDGHEFDTYRAEPTGKPRGGIVVLQEIFGVNEHIRAVADKFAGEGYTAIAPALFDRIEKNVEFGYNEEDTVKGRALRGKLGFDLPMLDIAAAIEALPPLGPRRRRRLLLGRIAGLDFRRAAKSGLRGRVLRRADQGFRGREAALPGHPSLWRKRSSYHGRDGGDDSSRASRGSGFHLCRRPRLQLRPARRFRCGSIVARFSANPGAFQEIYRLKPPATRRRLGGD